MPFFPEAPPAPPVEPVTDLMAFVHEYRATLPVVRNCIYLNHASVGPLSDWVVAAANEHLLQHQMGETTTQDDWYDGWRLARQRIAELIGAGKDDVCIQPNTWAAMARAFSALSLSEGDEVLFPADEFPSLYYALSEFRSRGCSVIGVGSGRGDGIVRTSDLLDAITSRTRLIATSWVNFFHGYEHDLSALSSACREHGIWFAVDAIQGLGMLPLDVKQHGIHFLACNGAKWLCSPLGSGFLYVAPDVPEAITPRLEGWFAMELNHENYTDRSLSPKSNANRFATGTVPLSPVFGLRKSCEIFLKAGPRPASQRALLLADQLATAALSADIGLVSDRSERKTAIISLRLADCPWLPGKLKAAKVAFSIRENAIRLSPHWYLLDEEIAKVSDIIGAGES
jgi:selenocysteine lyase/cysteine desulfurase